MPISARFSRIRRKTPALIVKIQRAIIVSCVIAGSLLTLASTGFAEDPVVVHYSDPSLARMEAQIGVTPAQKERFEDIVVKYRDPFNVEEAENPGQGKIHSGGTGRHGGARQSSQSSQDENGVPSRGRKTDVSRKELDELATILAPDQLKRFQELNNRRKGKRHPTSAG
jgi:hypothetical protein